MRTRLLPVAITILSLLPGVPLADSFPLREQSGLVAEARGVAGVRIENPHGLVRVGPSADGRIHLTALKLVRGGASRSAREFSQETRVETSRESGWYVVKVRYPQRRTIHVSLGQLLHGDFDLPRVEVRLALEVPARLPVQLATSSGDVETSALAGPQSLETTSGDIEARGAAGGLTVTTTSGDVAASDVGSARVRSVSGNVTLDGARGPLDVRTSSGDVEVHGAADSLDVGTVSGDVRVDRAPRGLTVGSTSGDILVDGPASGSVRVQSGSGEVRLDLGRGLRRADVQTVSGDVVVRLADGLGCGLDLESTSGTLDGSVPMRVRAVSRQRMTGVVLGGGAPVILRSLSGDIAVTGGGR